VERVGVRLERAGGEVILNEEIKQDIILFHLLNSILSVIYTINRGYKMPYYWYFEYGIH